MNFQSLFKIFLNFQISMDSFKIMKNEWALGKIYALTKTIPNELINTNKTWQTQWNLYLTQNTDIVMICVYKLTIVRFDVLYHVWYYQMTDWPSYFPGHLLSLKSSVSFQDLHTNLRKIKGICLNQFIINKYIFQTITPKTLSAVFINFGDLFTYMYIHWSSLLYFIIFLYDIAE